MATFVAPIRRENKPSVFSQILFVMVAGILLFFLASTAIAEGYQLKYAGHVFPGVSVAGVNISGLTPEAAKTKLGQEITFPYTGRIFLHYKGQVWQATPIELGLVLDLDTCVSQAYDIGRRGGIFGSLTGQVNAWKTGVSLPPVVVVDQRIAYAYLQRIAAQIDQPVLEADLHLNGTEVVYTAGQVGYQLNIDTTLVYVTTQLQAFRDGEITLTVDEQTPGILDASAQAATLRTLVGAPLTLFIPDMVTGDPGPWTVDVQTLAGMVSIQRQLPQYAISIDTTALKALMHTINEAVKRDPQDARFRFNDDSGQLDLIQDSIIGRELNVPMMEAAIQTRLLGGEHNLPLELVVQNPQIKGTDTGASLGITELVISVASYFRGSSEARMQNIRMAASAFDGLLVAPGATFSMGSALGDISLENGYQEAMIIYNGQTIKGVGGGVCQVSTTLFRAAFFAGFPIVERSTHAYRVSYYEQTVSGIDPSLAGLDATVYFPLVDLKFTNDTPYWLLMETYFNEGARRLTWKFYSTKDGRTVNWTTTGLQNIVPHPEPLFRENPDLGSGKMKQVDWQADGADIYVTRTVTYADGHLVVDPFTTHYQPWQAVCEYGSGTDHPRKLAQELGICQP
jgi:vancomycin resistance protein YoaR